MATPHLETLPSNVPVAEAVVPSIRAFLPSLPSQTLQRLYTLPSAVLAIYRLLPNQARVLLGALVWLGGDGLEGGIDESDHGGWRRESVERWAMRGRGGEQSKRHFNEALGALFSLHIIAEEPDHQRGGTRLVLVSSFRDCFRRALTGGGTHRSFGVPCDTIDTDAVGIDFLDDYANQQWETILHYMVGSELQAKPSQAVLQLLKRSGLMTESAAGSSHSLKITSRGFQFLLEDVNTQLWDLLLQYLGMIEDRGVDLVEVLGFVFMLGSLELGRDYSTEQLSRTQLEMLSDLRDYGLVYQRAASSKRFYPTRLATTLTSSAAPLISRRHEDEEKGFLILETNYRTYAYTSNPLQIAVLNLFVSLKSRFPNLVVGMVTRESIKRALANGIKAEQIISYLSSHAHPQMRKQNPLLPPTVVDQIRLWELEKNRIRSQEGFLYEDFRSTEDFELVLGEARKLQIVLWERPETRKFFVTSEGHNMVKEFIKRRMQKPGSGAG